MFSDNSITSRKNGGDKYLCRKELAHQLGVSLSTVDRGIRDNRWPFNAYIRLGEWRIGYPGSLLQEMKQSVKKGGKK
jgi:predicted DNA-binding transcriptional regulator AlpA